MEKCQEQNQQKPLLRLQKLRKNRKPDSTAKKIIGDKVNPAKSAGEKTQPK